METIEGKLKAVKGRFQEGSKQYNAARYIVRQNREILKEEQEKICQEIPIADKTLQGVFTWLRKMNLYPPDTSNSPSNPESSEETLHHIPEAPQIPLQEYATLEDLMSIRKDIQYLAAVISGEPTSNPGNYEEEEEPEVDQPHEMDVVQPEEMELIQPMELNIRDPSLTRKTIWLEPKTAMYYDMAREGTFANYAGSREMCPFIQFEKGTLSDFVNIIVDDYFNRNFNAGVGLLSRRYA